MKKRGIIIILLCAALVTGIASCATVSTEPKTADSPVRRFHDDEKGVTCWYIYHPVGTGHGATSAIDCMPDSLIE